MGFSSGAGELTLSRHADNGAVTGAAVGLRGDDFDHDEFGALASTHTTVGGTAHFGVSYTRDAVGPHRSQKPRPCSASRIRTVQATIRPEG